MIARGGRLKRPSADFPHMMHKTRCSTKTTETIFKKVVARMPQAVVPIQVAKSEIAPGDEVGVLGRKDCIGWVCRDFELRNKTRVRDRQPSRLVCRYDDVHWTLSASSRTLGNRIPSTSHENGDNEDVHPHGTFLSSLAMSSSSVDAIWGPLPAAA